MGTIYVLRNSLNGKCYVGQTRQPLRCRLESHRNSKSDFTITRAIKKYGFAAFAIYRFDFPNEALDFYEREMISRLCSLVPGGYNLDSGGRKNKIKHPLSIVPLRGKENGMFGKKHRPESIEKMRDSLKGRNWVCGKRGIAVPWFGKKLSEETKKKMSAAHMGKKRHPLSGELRKRLSIAALGRHNTAESKAKTARAMRERWQDPVYREHMLTRRATQGKMKESA